MANYNLDIRKNGRQFNITGLHTGDNGLRSFCFHFTDGGASFTIPSDCIPTLFARLPDGTSVYDTCTLSDNAVIYSLKGGTNEACITALAGKVDCEIRLTSKDGHILTSPRFSIIVESVLQNDEAIEACDSFSALTDALGRVLESEDGLSRKIDRVAGAEGNAAVFCDDGSLRDFGAPPVSMYNLKFDYSGTGSYDEENFSVFSSIYSAVLSGRPIAVTISYDTEFIPSSYFDYASTEWRFTATDSVLSYVYTIRIRFKKNDDDTLSLTKISYNERKSNASSDTEAAGVNVVPYYPAEELTQTKTSEILSSLEKAMLDGNNVSVALKTEKGLISATLSSENGDASVYAQAFSASPEIYEVTLKSDGTVTTSCRPLYSDDVEGSADYSAPSSLAVKNYVQRSCSTIVDEYLRTTLNGDEVSY